MRMIFDLLAFGCFLLILFYFGWRKAAGVESEEAYLMAGRRISLFPLTATLVMTELNTATLLAFSSLGYLAGKWALTLPLVFLIGLLFYALTVAKKWKGFNGVSVASFFSERFGKDVGLLASVALLLAMSGFSAAYVKSLYLLFTPLFPGMSPWALSSLLAAFVLLMVVRGGLVSIVQTDLFSFVLAMIFFPLLAIFAFKMHLGAPVEILDAKVLLPPRFILSLIVLTMFTYILAPWYGQKIFAARSKKTAYLAVVLSALLVFFLYGLGVVATWFFRKNGGVAPSADQALPFVINQALPNGLRGLGYGILFAASATTLSGVWSAMSSLVVGDFLSRKGEKSHRRSMGLTTCFAITSLLLANLLEGRVLDKLILANIPVAALSFALLAGFYWQKTSRIGVYASMLVGWGWALFSYFYFGETGGYLWYWVMGGIPAIFITGVVFSLIFPNRSALVNY